MFRLALHWQILIGMAIGVVVGLPLNILAEMGHISEDVPRTVAKYGKGVGDLFLRALSMIVVPLIMTSLISGVTAVGKLKGLARLGGRTITYYIVTSMLAITTGIFFVNVIRPGEGAELEVLRVKVGASAEAPDVAERSLGETLHGQLESLIPTNVFHVMADPGNRSILGVISF